MQIMTFSCPDDGKELKLHGVAYLDGVVALVGQCPSCQNFVRVELGDVMYKLIADNDQVPTHFAS